jgi:hypothetical protein
LREIIDLLNNGSKSGALEVQTQRFRVSVFVDNGRIQAVTGSGIDPADVASYMPASLAELAPIIKFTVSGRRGSEVDGLVELLDNKVLDPRLLKKLLRLQAAILLRFAFTGQLKSFRFDQGEMAPMLYRKLPLDSSLLALLVEGAMVCREDELPKSDAHQGFARQPIHGQNLDRAGLSSRHLNLMSALAEPTTCGQLAQRLGWPEDEVRRVLHAFELAELVERRTVRDTTKVFAVASHPEIHSRLNHWFKSASSQVSGKLVRDWLALGLLLRRNKPEVLIVEADDEAALVQLQKLAQDAAEPLAGVRFVGVRAPGASGDVPHKGRVHFVAVLNADAAESQWRAALAPSAENAADERRERAMPALAGVGSGSELSPSPVER